MAAPKVMVLRAAGTNCDRETAFGFERAGAETRSVHVNRLLETPNLLGEVGLLALPGGFSYGDHVGAGRLLGAELRERLGDALQAFVARDGLVLGICNGFQVLVRTGLLPDPGWGARLDWNRSDRYEARWVRLAVDARRCVFAPDGEALALPVGHAEGRFDADGREDELVADGRAVFRYLDEQGRPTEDYPANPNGSRAAIAGVCDPSGRVLGLMPHPDRAIAPENHPDWHRGMRREEGDGMRIFRAATAAMRRD